MITRDPTLLSLIPERIWDRLSCVTLGQGPFFSHMRIGECRALLSEGKILLCLYLISFAGLNPDDSLRPHPATEVYRYLSGGVRLVIPLDFCSVD